MSVQFDPPKGLNQAHVGAFWETQREFFPQVRSVAPITTSEVFEDQGQWLPPSLRVAISNVPELRLQMVSSDDQWMCQLQCDRLVMNWRRRDADYPRYRSVLSRFLQAWNQWKKFIEERQIDAPLPRTWELTYVNRIPKGDLWETQGDWPRIFPGLWGGRFSEIDNTTFRGVQGRWVWESRDPRARLYIEPRPGRSSDEPPMDVLLLSVTARGVVTVPESDVSELGLDRMTSHIESGLSFGHQLVVTAFDTIASDSAKAVWGRYASDTH